MRASAGVWALSGVEPAIPIGRPPNVTLNFGFECRIGAGTWFGSVLESVVAAVAGKLGRVESLAVAVEVGEEWLGAAAGAVGGLDGEVEVGSA